MVIDLLEQGGRYAHLHPSFARAFEFLRDTHLASLPPGRHDIHGDAIYVSIDLMDGRGRRARASNATGNTSTSS